MSQRPFCLADLQAPYELGSILQRFVLGVVFYMTGPAFLVGLGVVKPLSLGLHSQLWTETWVAQPGRGAMGPVAARIVTWRGKWRRRKLDARQVAVERCKQGQGHSKLAPGTGGGHGLSLMQPGTLRHWIRKAPLGKAKPSAGTRCALTCASKITGLAKGVPSPGASTVTEERKSVTYT